MRNSVPVNPLGNTARRAASLEEKEAMPPIGQRASRRAGTRALGVAGRGVAGVAIPAARRGALCSLKSRNRARQTVIRRP